MDLFLTFFSINLDGSPYIIGSKENEQWYLFTSDNSSNFYENDDVTLEILMSDMDNKAMIEFTKLKNKSSAEVIKVCHELYCLL